MRTQQGNNTGKRSIFDRPTNVRVPLWCHVTLLFCNSIEGSETKEHWRAKRPPMPKQHANVLEGPLLLLHRLSPPRPLGPCCCIDGGQPSEFCPTRLNKSAPRSGLRRYAHGASKTVILFDRCRGCCRASTCHVRQSAGKKISLVWRGGTRRRKSQFRERAHGTGHLSPREAVATRKRNRSRVG